MKRGARATLKSTGELVEILSAEDGNDTAVWVYFVNDSDRDAIIARADLVLA